jgi:hypothetical protein
MTTKYILETDFGVTCTLAFDEETGIFNCVWEGLPKHLNHILRDKILSAYVPWRDQILGDWAKRTGKKVLVVDC